MHFLIPKYIVKQRKENFLKVETGSGRSTFIFYVLIILYFQEPYILYPGILICILVWTYKTEWILDRQKAIVRYEKRILWIIYEDDTIEASTIREMLIKKKPNGSGVGYCYQLLLITNKEEKHCVATRGYCSQLKPIVNDLKRFLPDSVIYQPHPDCSKKEHFISFE